MKKRKAYSMLVYYYMLTFIYLIVYVGAYITIQNFPNRFQVYYMALYYGKNLVMILFFACMPYVIFELIKKTKENWILDLFVMDIPALLMLTYEMWYPFITERIDWKYDILRAYMFDEKTANIMMCVGAMLVGIEFIRFKMSKRK